MEVMADVVWEVRGGERSVDSLSGLMDLLSEMIFGLCQEF